MNTTNSDTPTTVDDLRYLEPFGLDLLTGEADGLSMRLLFDVTPDGEKLLSDFLGGCTLTSGAWNGTHKSVMLARSILPDLVAFCMLRAGSDCVVTLPKYRESDRIPFAIGMNKDQWPTRRAYLERYAHYYERAGTAADGFRNRHEFTGRVG